MTLANELPITERDQLVSYLEAGCKPKSDWRVGIENEKFAFHWDTLKPVGFDGPTGLEVFLRNLRHFGWEELQENGRTIALSREHSRIWLEPGGQVELSGTPFTSIHEIDAEVKAHVGEINEVGQSLGIGFIGLGFQPLAIRSEFPTLPKARQDLMRAYMARKGSRGLDMMHGTCTTQANFDFADEVDMVRKLRVSLKLQPVVTAIFANSPFSEGKPNGFETIRSAIWLDVDPDRTGLMPFAFEDGFGFERYVDYALDVPLYFIQRQGHYIDAAGQSFRDFLQGRLPALPGETPTLADWNDQLSNIFTEVRLKQYLEMRGSDAGNEAAIAALPALWTGLLYDDAALNEAEALTDEITLNDLTSMRQNTPQTGLHTKVGTRTVHDLARSVLTIARKGLQSRSRRNPMGEDETKFLQPVEEIIRSGHSSATRLRQRYHDEWHEDIRPLFRENCY